MSVSSNASRRARSAVLVSFVLSVIGGALAGVIPGIPPALSAAPAGAAVAVERLEPARPVERVLLISVPHVGWEELDAADAPNLKRLLADSAVANLTARSGGGGFASGYLTLGAGKRSKGTATPSDGMGFGVDDPFGDDTAGAAFGRRTGVERDRGLVHLGIVSLQDVNEAEAGGSSVGALGTAVRDAGFSTAVIGNSDGNVPDDNLARYRRYLLTGLMSENGVADGGRVDRSLLAIDPAMPFGLRLDEAAVLDAFREAWVPRSVVLVEASDLLRAVAARPPTASSQDSENFAVALERTDELVGALLDEIDPARDAVVVVSPYGSRVSRGLTIVGVRAPGVPTGTMSSSSTRRDGFVLLADVAPSVLRLLELPRAGSMNGRTFTVDPSDAPFANRVDHFVDETEAALFRDRVLTTVTVYAMVVAGLVAFAAVLTWELRRRGPWRAFARFGSSWLLALVPAVYLARLLPFHDAPTALYYLFLTGVALLLAAAYEALGARDPTTPTVLGLGVVVALLVVDLLTGAHLQLSTAFGYTPSIGVRFSGVGNVAYAFLAASTILLAGFVAHRIGGRRGVWLAVALMAVALVVDAAPMLGGDVGGALSLTPAYLVTALLLFGGRIRWRTVVWLAVAGVVALGVAALVDLARPARDRTHLGRLITNARERGFSEITDVIGRKLERNLDTWTTSAWRSMLAIGVVFLAYLAWRQRDRVAALVRRVPELRASLVGFAVLVVLGYAVNDSGVAIPAVMLYVLVATLVGLLMRAEVRVEVPDPATEGDQPAPTTSSSTATVRAATPSH